MRPIPETVVEKRTRAGVLVASQRLGPSEGWALAVARGRVVAATEAAVSSYDLDLEAVVRLEVLHVRSVVAHESDVLLAHFDREGTVRRVDPSTLRTLATTTIGAPVHDVVGLTRGFAASDNRGCITLVEDGSTRPFARRAHAMVSIDRLAGDRIAAASLVKTVLAFAPDGGKRVWEDLASIPYRLAASGETIAAGVGTRVWIGAADTGATHALTAHRGIVSALTFDAHGMLWSAGEEGWIHAWERAAHGFGPSPSASIAGRGRILAITTHEDALFVLRRT